MNAVELLLPGGKQSGVWMCSTCRVLAASCHAPVRSGDRDTTWEERSEYAQKRAERCCNWTCQKCGEKTRPHNDLCDKCFCEKSRRNEREREAKRYEKATKLTVEEWGKSDTAEWLYDNACDKWFRDPDDAEEWYADDPERTRPLYLWCSEPVKWQPDASGYIADQIHDHFHEDAGENITDAEYKRLDAFVDAWWAEQGVVSYEPDFSRCVLLPEVADAPAIVEGDRDQQ